MCFAFKPGEVESRQPVLGYSSAVGSAVAVRVLCWWLVALGGALPCALSMGSLGAIDLPSLPSALSALHPPQLGQLQPSAAGPHGPPALSQTAFDFCASCFGKKKSICLSTVPCSDSQWRTSTLPRFLIFLPLSSRSWETLARVSGCLICQSLVTRRQPPVLGSVLTLGPGPLDLVVVTLVICHLEVTSVCLVELLAGALKTPGLSYSL